MENETLLSIFDLKKDLDLGEIGDRFCDYGGHYYIGDVLNEIADNAVDIYYSDLFKWLLNNYEWVDEAQTQGLCEGCNNISKQVQMGQYLYYENDLNKHLDDALKNYCLNHIRIKFLIEGITANQWQEIEDKCTDVNLNDNLEDFEEFIQELFNIIDDDIEE